MNLTIDKFVRNFCVRKKEHVLHPPVNNIKDFTLPRNSRLHFLDKDGEEIGIKADNPLLSYLDNAKKVSEFVRGYKDDSAGGFKTVTVDINEQVRDYYRRNKGIVNGAVSKSDAMLDKNLVITNYSLMEAGVKYFNNQFAWHLQFQNRWNSISQYLEESASKDRRNHFVIVDIPDSFPSVSQLVKLEKEQTNDIVKKIANSQRMLISSFWNWFNETDRTVISRDLNLNSRLYYIFRYHDKWICVNLKTIKEFMKTPGNTRGSFSERQMKKNFLVMLLTMIFGSIDSVLLDEEDGEQQINPNVVEADEEETSGVIPRHETMDTSLQLNTTPDANELDAIKGDIKKALEAAVIKVEETDEYVEIETKRDKKVDRMLEGLETLNANAVEATENVDSPEQSIIKDDAGENVVASIDKSDLVIDYKEYNPAELSHEEAYTEKLRESVLRGHVTPQQMKRFEKLSKRYKEIPDPVTGKGTLDQAALINKKDLVLSKDNKFIDKINMVGDESMLKSTLIEFDKKYVDDVMQKDIYNSVLAIQRRGIAVQNYQVKRVKRLGDEYDVHSIKLVPIEGESSTTTFKVPVIDGHGVFNSRSVKLRSRKQRIDCPIRKISHDEVALTSDVSKFFVERSQFTAYSSEIWLRGQLVMIDDPNVKIRWGNASTVVEGKAFDRQDAESGTPLTSRDIVASKRTPRIYSTFGRYVKSIKTKEHELFFNASELEQNFGKDVVAIFEESRGTQILLGKGKNTILILTTNGIVHECSIDKNINVELGSLEKFLGIDVTKRPTDCADILMLQKTIPIGVLLGFYLGLGNLLKTLKASSRFIAKNVKGKIVLEHEVDIVFSDGSLIIDCSEYKTKLIVAGFRRYKNYIKQFSVYDFDKPVVYGAVFAEAGLPARFLREFSILRDMWIDPITRGELKAMNEPTDFVLLLIRAVELLEYDQHPEEMDRAYQRDRGYERISGFIYSELVKSIRAYDSTPVRDRAKVSMNPEAVWMDLIGDETTAPIEESNPIHNLKEMETVVYRGSGGRTARTMNANSRKFSKNSIGVDSESTVDNGDAGTVRYLAANPNYNSVRGTVNSLDVLDETVNSSCLNTSFLLAPGLEFDDAKRRNFCQIQQSRTTNSEGAHISPVRTGYERVVPYRTSDLYATMSSGEGTIIRVTDSAVVVKYKNGKEQSIELGKRDGKWAGKIIPHNVITNLKEGQKVKEGDALAFNPMFFEIDALGGTLAYKSGVLCRVGLVEEEFTFEDASEISTKFSDKLITKNCEERYITVTFDQEVNHMVKVGGAVEYDTTLCVLQNNIGGVVNAFSADSIEALKDISSLTPRAKYDGVITDITAIYVGEVEEMSQSLQDIVNASDRKLYKKARDMGMERVTGQKRIGDRFEGKTLEPNSVVIKVVIDITQDMGIGSKVVYSHQMKSVVSNVWSEDFTTQDGQTYDAKYSYTSFIKRIVKSGIIVGILNTYLVETGKRFCEIYEDV